LLATTQNAIQLRNDIFNVRVDDVVSYVAGNIRRRRRRSKRSMRRRRRRRQRMRGRIQRRGRRRTGRRRTGRRRRGRGRGGGSDVHIWPHRLEEHQLGVALRAGV
jgi:hypothetical protein